jgi:hypothetical protein
MKLNPNLVFPGINKLNFSLSLQKIASSTCRFFMNFTIVLDFFTTSFIYDSLHVLDILGNKCANIYLL